MVTKKCRLTDRLHRESIFVWNEFISNLSITVTHKSTRHILHNTVVPTFPPFLKLSWVFLQY